MNRFRDNGSPDVSDDVIDLREFFRVLWRGKWLIAGTTFCAIVVAVIFALVLPNLYRAEALLAPNDQEVSSGLSALASQYGGLASLAGINLGNSSTNKTTWGLETLKSRRFISEFIERHDIIVPLMASKNWDAKSGELLLDSDKYDVATKRWTRSTRPPRKARPSMQEAHEKFLEALFVSQDSQTGLVSVAIEHVSPVIAKDWVERLVEDLNRSMMRQDVASAEQAIDYLQAQIQKTSLAGLQSIFFGLIEEQTKTVMLAQVSDEYLLKTLDPAVVPEKPIRPKRALMVLFAALLGCVLGIVLVSIFSRKGER